MVIGKKKQRTGMINLSLRNGGMEGLEIDKGEQRRVSE